MTLINILLIIIFIGMILGLFGDLVTNNDMERREEYVWFILGLTILIFVLYFNTKRSVCVDFLGSYSEEPKYCINNGRTDENNH